jgi:ABC-type antimicrobial peptide transport system, permease component
MKILLNSFRIAVKAMNRNKLRTGLTMLGMTIGVAAVLAMIALGTGAQSSVSSSVRSAGTTLIFVRSGNFTRGGEDMHIATGLGSAHTLIPADATAIGQIPGISAVSNMVKYRGWVSNGDTKQFTQVYGTDATYKDAFAWENAKGKYFRKSDVESASQVAVLGPQLRDELFGPDVNPDGKEIQIYNRTFKVVGVIRSIDDDQQADNAFVPWTTLQQMLGINYVQDITVSASEAGNVTDLSISIEKLLRQRHHLDDKPTSAPQGTLMGNQMPSMSGGTPDDFTVKTQESEALTKGLYTSVAAFILANMPKVDDANMKEMSGTLTRAGATMTALLAAIATISLVVGGIGIMNIMLISVTERTREIGIRRAIGARSRDIMVQFLVEALSLGMMGGMLGIVLGFLTALIVTQVLQWSSSISFASVAMSFGIAATTGIIFGFYPARRASRLNPIDALRFE